MEDEINAESYDFFHSINSEKAHAIARYKLFTNIAKMFQLIELFVAIALISWSWIRLPFVFKFSSDYLLSFTSYLMNQHVVFLVGNAIVFLCYVISRYSNSGNESIVSGIYYNESKQQQQQNSTIWKSFPNTLNTKHVPLQVTETQAECKDLVIPDEKVITETVPEQELAPVTVIKQAAKQIERFRRTQSDLRSKISVKNDGELRRSATERRRRMTVDGESPEKSFPAVDELSNEEFRIAVERFILQQQKILKQQRLFEDGS
ncbi:hypothetical protein QVD17_15983 [Tagetes erecta]|uniref:Transmembrane protein n=1 Tax=Tagetes erecta TaxID=13708 RepID=A0AAD8KWZ6_TARER|nr:hypothetical protein QVD17_15983 [Tagetes erecta]